MVDRPGNAVHPGVVGGTALAVQPHRADAAARLQAITDTRTALLAGLIGVGALLTFWLNRRVYQIAARTLEVTEQGQIIERYTRAIEQLGQAELAMRLGWPLCPGTHRQ